MHALLPSVPPTLQQATADPSLCQRLLDTHGQPLLGSLLLSPGAHKVLFVPSKSLFPQSCVISGSSMVGLMVTSSKRAYAKPRSVAPRAPALRPATADLYTTGDAQTQFWLSVCWLGIHFVPFLCLSSSLRVKLVIFIFIAIVNKKFFHWVYE